MIIHIKVTPNAKKTEITQAEKDYLKIRVQAVPDQGKANRTLIAFLSLVFKKKKSAITILSGETSREKKIEIDDLSKEEFNLMLQKWLVS